MEITVKTDWKTVAAVGAVVVGFIFARKMNANEAATVTCRLADTAAEYVKARNSK